MHWRALLTGLIMAALPAHATPPNVIIAAEYAEPTTRYDHGILGDAIEWGALNLTVDMCSQCENTALRSFTIRLPQNRVFEDIAPRIVKVIDEGGTEVMVVETDLNKGARLALYDESGLITATPFIGRTHRWLAPIGAADLDGDGSIEVAYVDRPHLARLIRVWRYKDGKLVLAGELPGYTNHRIGEDNIAGGIRDCGNGPEMIVADAGWQNIVAVRFTNGKFTTRILAPHQGRKSFATAMSCKS
ncbi:MAG: hypothetical protein ACU0CA_12900 [Paracoccaceae bacterium]